MITRSLLCLVLMAFQAVVAGDKQDKKSSKIQFAETAFDLGQIQEGQVVEHTFTFANRGSDTLRISKVDASCGCTAALASANVVAPGGEGGIKASFNSAGRIGKTKKSVYVRSNDPASPLVTLTFTVEVLAKDAQSSVMDVLKTP